MTHCYAACMLLEHGPLTYAEFCEITGWPSARTILHRLIRRGWVERASLGASHFHYRLVTK